MDDREQALNAMIQRHVSSFVTPASSVQKPQNFSTNPLDISQLNTNQIHGPMHNFSPNFSQDSNKRPGIPPSHPQIPPVPPYSQIPVSRLPSAQQLGSQNFAQGPSHSISLSQPTFFNMDYLPPLNPSLYRDSPSTSIYDPVSLDVSMEDRDGILQTPPPPSYTGANSLRIGESLPPCKVHRGSNSDIPFDFSNANYSPSFLPHQDQPIFGQSASAREHLGVGKPIQLDSEWNREGDINTEGMDERRSLGDFVDQWFNNDIDNDNDRNTGGMDERRSQGDFVDQWFNNDCDNDNDRNTEGMDERGCQGDFVDQWFNNDSDNEESRMNSCNSMHRVNLSSSTERRGGRKRSAAEDIAQTTHHCRNISVDSFMDGIPNLGGESPKLPPSMGTLPGQHSHSNALNGASVNGELSGPELNKTMAKEKLAEPAEPDPKRAKRIMSNRQSAARSKARKTKHMSELVHRSQTLRAEATKLSGELTVLQRDSFGITNQSNELKFHIQVMEQQAQLRQAINVGIINEIQQIRGPISELHRELHSTNSLSQQLPMNTQLLQQQKNNGATANSQHK